MNCREVQTRITAWQDQELSPGEHTQVTEHFRRCAPCRSLEARLARVTPKPFLDAPETDWSRLEDAIDEEWARPHAPAAPRWWQRTHSLPRGAVALYAAALFGALLWGVHGWRSAQTPSPNTAAGPVVPIPSEDYRPAGWTPEAPPP